jgi:hypothetical protein|tara:strand:- start:1863 stop:4301 length:2439 start_codon:yes stop_codon:yes gene_type:complete
MLKTLTEISYIRQKGLLNESKENDETVIKKTLLDIGNVIDGTFTFGTGITAFLPGVRSLLNGEMPYLSEQSIALIYITAIWIVLNRHGDKVPKLIAVIKNDGLSEVLNKVVTFLKSLEEVGLKIANEVGYAASNIADIGAFTFLAFPVLDATLYLIGNDSITLADPSSYLKSVLISIGILSVKNIFNSVIKKIKSRFGTLEESKIIHNDKGITKDIFQVIKNTLFETSSQTWFLPEELGLQENYILGENKYGVELEISRKLKKENYILEITTGKNDNILVDLQINPHSEPRIYKHIYNTLVECISRFNEEKHKDTLLVEQDSSSKFKDFLDSENLNITIPLTWDSLCGVNSEWCEASWLKDRLKGGTPYIIKDKRDGKKYLLHHLGKIPMLLDEANFNLYNEKAKSIIYKKYFSELPEAIKAFNLDYSWKERIKYSMPLEEEKSYIVNSFSKAIYKIMTTETSQSEREAIISEFLGEDFKLSRLSWGDNPDKNQGRVDVFSDGIQLQIESDHYQEDYLLVGDDDAYYFNQAMGYPYGDYYDEIDEDELNYINCWFNNNAYSKLMELFAALDQPTHDRCTEWDDGDINEKLQEFFPEEWDNVSSSILDEVGYGVGSNRAKELKEYILDDTLLPFEDVGQYYKQDMTWVQLLGIIENYKINNLSELVETEANEIESGLSDIWYDTYDWSEDTEDLISDRLTEFIDKVMEEGDLVKRKENQTRWKETIQKIKELKNVTLSEFSGYFGNHWRPAWTIVIKSQPEDRSIPIHSVDYKDGLVTLADKNKKFYKIKMEDLIPNHILSQPLNFPEEETSN